MKKIIPFNKDILFKTNIGEITSISLDHELSIENSEITGNFKISGDYKMLETSVNSEPFSYDLPFSVEMDEKYILDKAKLDIDDFYYEVVGDNVLRVGIDVLLDNIEEKEIEVVEQRCVEEEEPVQKPEKKDNTYYDEETNETYKSYTVYIMREEDNILDIIKKYETSKEELEEYNDLTNLKIGDKIIIPS